MKKNKSSLLLFFALCISAFFSCKKETPPAFQEDKKAPEIFFSSPSLVPLGQYSYVVSGNLLPIDIRFEDDVELSDYFIAISPRGDISYMKSNFDRWTPTRVGFLHGNVDGFNESIHIADDPIGGIYDFQVTVFDKSGKSSVKTSYIYVLNKADTIFPNLVITEPNPNNVQTFSIGSNLIVRGSATDNDFVDDITIRLRSISSGSIIAQDQVFIDTLNTGSYAIDTFMNVNSANVSPGSYDVEVIMRDAHQNPIKKTSRIIFQ